MRLLLALCVATLFAADLSAHELERRRPRPTVVIVGRPAPSTTVIIRGR